MECASPARVVVSAALLAAVVVSEAASDEIDDYLQAATAERAIPGLALAVVRGGAAIVRVGAYGRANVELDAPVVEASAFPIASLDKELTASGVMRLVERGRVSIDDPVARWVDVPWTGLRVRHLLTHTSGLPDEVAPTASGRALFEYTSDDLVGRIRELEPVAPPGERYLYSDANFVLAQLVIERASGEPWRTFMEREVFGRAGVAASYFDPPAILPGRVAPYVLGPDGTLRRDPSRDIDYGPLYNDVAMPAREFARWLAALDQDAVLSAATRSLMWTPVRLADGSEAREVGQWPAYGFGFGLDRLFGHRVVVHSGYTGVGFVKLPDDNLSVVIFTNLRHSSGSDPVGIAYGVVGRLLPALSLEARQPAADADPARTVALRAEYERLLVGAPNLGNWVDTMRTAAWEGAVSLAARSPRLGPLLGFEPLEGDRAAGELLFRARHEHGRLFVRFALAPDGRIASLVWHHL